MENGSTDTVQVLPLEDVYANPRHYREVKKANVERIAASIAEAGQLVPIEVWRDGDIYYVDQGHHRLEAMKQLGHETIRAIVSDGESAVSMVASNLSIPETELEKSRGTQLMLSLGVRPEAAAVHTGVEVRTVEKAARGAKAIGESAYEMSLERLAAIAEFEDDPASMKIIAEAPEKSWQQAVHERRRERERENIRAAARALAEEAGLPVYNIGDDLPEDAKVAYGPSLTSAPDEAVGLLVNVGYLTANWLVASDSIEDDAEAEARRRAEEQRIIVATALEAAHERRMEFVRAHLMNEGPTSYSNDLRDFAVDLWDNHRISADSRLPVDYEPLARVRGLLPRFYASLLSRAEEDAVMVLSQIEKHRGGYSYWLHRTVVGRTLVYLASMRAVGYVQNEFEDELVSRLENHLLDSEGVDDE